MRRPSTDSSTRYRNWTVVFGPHFLSGSSSFTATVTTGAELTGFLPRTIFRLPFFVRADFLPFPFTPDATAVRRALLTGFRLPFPDFLIGDAARLAGRAFSGAFLLPPVFGRRVLFASARGVFFPALPPMLRSPVTPAAFLTFDTSSPRLCNGSRMSSGFVRY